MELMQDMIRVDPDVVWMVAARACGDVRNEWPESVTLQMPATDDDFRDNAVKVLGLIDDFDLQQ